MATSLLASQAGIIDASGSAGEDQELIPVLLGSLTDRELQELERRAGHIREVLSAPPGASKSREGSCATPPKPRSWASPSELSNGGWPATSTRVSRVSRTTGNAPASGLWCGPSLGYPCLAVVADLTTASTPTMGTVIERIERELEAAHGPGIVPLPSRATAYRRPSDKGSSTQARSATASRRWRPRSRESTWWAAAFRTRAANALGKLILVTLPGSTEREAMTVRRSAWVPPSTATI